MTRIALQSPCFVILAAIFAGCGAHAGSAPAVSAATPVPSAGQLLRMERDYIAAANRRDEVDRRALYGVELLLNAQIVNDPRAPAFDRDKASAAFADFCAEVISRVDVPDVLESCQRLPSLVRAAPGGAWRTLKGAQRPVIVPASCAGVRDLLPDAIGPDAQSTEPDHPDPVRKLARARFLVAAYERLAGCALQPHPPEPAYLLRSVALRRYENAGLLRGKVFLRSDDLEAFEVAAGIANDPKAPAPLRNRYASAFVNRCISTQRYLPQVENARCTEDLARMATDPHAVMFLLVDTPYEFGDS